MMPDRFQTSYNRWSAVSIFLLSMVIISLQLMLMRALSVSYYYHFSYLVISTALLGFGASGTLLSLTYNKLKKRFSTWTTAGYLLFLVSIPAAYLAAQQLSIDVRYLLYSWRQFFLLSLYNLLLFIPFFIGAWIIGFKLTYFKKEVPELYGANLVGSGIGGIVAVAIMYTAPAYLLPLRVTPIALLALIAWLLASRYHKFHPYNSILLGLLALFITVGTQLVKPSSSIDDYKDLSHFIRLEQQDDATHVVQRYGPRAQIDIYRSPTIHSTMFAGLQADTLPPSQMAVLMDGHTAGTIFSIQNESGARILDFTPQSMPYRLLDNPRVLLLGEVGGVNVWLARRFGAESVTVVQNNPQILELMNDALKEQNGDVYRGKDVEVINQHPRLFLEQSEEQYDIIQFVTAEGTAAGSGGLQGLHEDFLLTTESFATAIDRLSSRGFVSITRGIQSPPRDNIKLFALSIDALRTNGVEHPGAHLLISRNYLAVNSLIAKAEISDRLVDRHLNTTENLNLDREYYPGIISGDIKQLNHIEGPDQVPYSYLHHSLLQLLSANPESFYENWVYQVAAPTDNRPYFFDFFKWKSLNRFMDTYGRQWFRKLELGYVILIFTFIELFVAAFVLILLPLILSRSTFSRATHKLPAVLHFGAIGIGFMFLEIMYLQMFTKFLGDPIYSAAAVLTSLLVFSGIGSHMQKKLPGSPSTRIRAGATAVSVITALYLLLLDPVLSTWMDLSTPIRFIITTLFLMPVSFFMGWMFPSGMQLLDQYDDQLIPWAWGVNGFASVTASPLAVMLSMSLGFDWVMIFAIAAYLCTIPVTRLWR